MGRRKNRWKYQDFRAIGVSRSRPIWQPSLRPAAANPTLHVVAGPSDCGKSTLTRISGFSGLEIIDPDALARSMPAGNAAREALRRRRRALGERRSYLVETTLAGARILFHMEAVRWEGDRIVLRYVSLSSPDQSLDRIRNRVALGGHHVPEADARRRFSRSRSNLPTVAALADEVIFYDNTMYRRIA